jgi:hypothetical protein
MSETTTLLSMRLNLPPLQTHTIDPELALILKEDLNLVKKELLHQRKGTKTAITDRIKYENNYFTYNDYCNCDKPLCTLCNQCTCPEYRSEFREILLDITSYWSIPYLERSKSQALLTPTEYCLHCQGTTNPIPNFTHKKSGSEITWYKTPESIELVILRSNWASIMKEVLASIR